MKLDYIKYAWDNVRHRKLRSWLTIISILIGIMSIYTLISFGQGVSNYVNELSSDVGKDKLIVQAKGVGAPGTDETFNVKKNEIIFLSKVNGIKEIVGVYFKVVEIEWKKEKKFVFSSALNVDEHRELVKETFALKLDRGRELKKGDKFKAVLGYNYQFPDKIFNRALNLQNKILINDKNFEIIGFYKSVGNPQDDSNVYFTEEAFELLFPKRIDKFQMAIARTDPNAVPSEVAELAEDKLRKFKDQDPGQEDFFIQTFEQAIETFTNILTIINVILVLIALISLIVAGVNIMNTMYTSVLERTKEIGIMKAIGAQNQDILFIFLFESGFLGLTGGVLGVILGYVISKAGGVLAANAGFGALQPTFPLFLTIGSLLFAFLVGAGAGIFPAIQASKLKPVDALRYE